MHVSPPLKRTARLSVAIPSSIVSDVPHMREKTAKIGLLGRALAIFRVDEVIVFPDQPDRDQTKETNFITLILSYMETPQYLRKYLFKVRIELKYAGILPPLRTPHHPIRNREKDLKKGEYREGVVVGTHRNRCLVDIGVEHPLPVHNVNIPLESRVTIRVAEKGEHRRAVLAKPDEIEIYWGYRVTSSKISFSQMIKNTRFNFILATSRYGKSYAEDKGQILESWKKSKSVLVAFGSPTQGLHEIANREGLKLPELVDIVINTIPNQATETVRTEEAVYATLAVLNLCE